MAKETILDRLAGAMKTLGERKGKVLTPRQRVAAAQRFNELGSIGQSELASMAMDDPRYPEIHRRLNKMGLINNEEELQDNPFLSDNIDKYAEQDEFLDWCRYNRVEPNARSLKQFRWETYKMLPYRQQQWIANKDAIKSYLGPEMYGYDKQELDRINTLGELEDYLQEAHPEDGWPARYPMQDSPVFESMDEFPDDFDYMWRY